MQDNFYKLDNPAWYSLTESHAIFSFGDAALKRYRPDIVAFASFNYTNQPSLNRLDELMNTNEYFFIIGELSQLPSNYTIVNILSCEQMVCDTEIKISLTNAIEKLGEPDEDEMVSLI